MKTTKWSEIKRRKGVKDDDRDTSGEPIVNSVNSDLPAEQGEGEHTETGTDAANIDNKEEKNS